MKNIVEGSVLIVGPSLAVLPFGTFWTVWRAGRGMVRLNRGLDYRDGKSGVEGWNFWAVNRNLRFCRLRNRYSQVRAKMVAKDDPCRGGSDATRVCVAGVWNSGEIMRSPLTFTLAHCIHLLFSF